jgi:hypothetical protein
MYRSNPTNPKAETIHQQRNATPLQLLVLCNVSDILVLNGVVVTGGSQLPNGRYTPSSDNQNADCSLNKPMIASGKKKFGGSAAKVCAETM